MPSRRSARGARGLVLLVGLAALAAPWPAPAAAPAASRPATPSRGAITDGEVRAALTALQSDPQMGGMAHHRRLHWRESERNAAQPMPWLERVLRWLAQTGAWFASSARALLLVAVAICVALLAVVVWRAWRRQPRATPTEDGPPPTHVRGLDIRPDELPADVPAAARAHWRTGERRAALVLLYRSLLSRLAHGFQLPIRDSSTEGDCLSLASGRLPEPAYAYASQFVRIWLAALYAGQWPEEDHFEALCAGHWQLQDTPR